MFRLFVVAAVVVIALGLVAGTMFPNASSALGGKTEVSKNLRLDLKLEVDGQPRTYSVVQHYVLTLAGGDGSNLVRSETRIDGQALAAELAPDLPLLIVLMRRGSEEAYDEVIAGCIMNGQASADFFEAVETFRGPCQVPAQWLPVFITIADRGNPRSIVKTSPTDTLGGRVQFKGLLISATNEPVTTGISEMLPWLKPGGHPPVNIYGMDYSGSPNGLPLVDMAFYRRPRRQ